MRMFQVCVCGQPMQLRERPTPKPTGTQVLLKVLAAGVCHSDLHLSDGYFDLGGGKKMSLADRGMVLPLTLGHENVGEVVAVGPDAKGVKIGARLLADRIMVMRPRPGRVADEIAIDLTRPRDRQSAAFDFAKRRVLAALDRSLDRQASVDETEHKAAQSAAMWW